MTFTLRPYQQEAVDATLAWFRKHREPAAIVLPTGAGKSLVIAELARLARGRVLVLAHVKELVAQNHAKYCALGLEADIFAAGLKRKESHGKVVFGSVQSVARNLDLFRSEFSLLIVDECHRISDDDDSQYQQILAHLKAVNPHLRLLGLTATPIRRDGQQPIIFMQCGPIRYTAAKPAGAPRDLEVLPRSRFGRIDVPTDAGIQDVFRHLANDSARTAAIAAEVRDAVAQGRKVLVLTERTEHLDAIKTELDSLQPAPFVLHGRMSRKQRATLVADLDALPPDAPRVLLSTGKLVGEGFDHPPLDTLVLAMPVSWRGTLQQYAGRLHREHASKTDVRIIDFVDTGHPALLRMWDKRQRGYRAMGYRISSEDLK